MLRADFNTLAQNMRLRCDIASAMDAAPLDHAQFPVGARKRTPRGYRFPSVSKPQCRIELVGSVRFHAAGGGLRRRSTSRMARQRLALRPLLRPVLRADLSVPLFVLSPWSRPASRGPSGRLFDADAPNVRPARRLAPTGVTRTAQRYDVCSGPLRLSAALDQDRTVSEIQGVSWKRAGRWVGSSDRPFDEDVAVRVTARRALLRHACSGFSGYAARCGRETKLCVVEAGGGGDQLAPASQPASTARLRSWFCA